MARPHGFTPELGEAILADVERGLFVTQIGLNNDCHPNTIRNWVRRGLLPDAVEPFRTFAARYIRAEAKVEGEVLDAVRCATQPQIETETVAEQGIDAEGNSFEKTRQVERTKPGDWRAGAWFAERRWPRRWGSEAWKSPSQDDLSALSLLDEGDSRGSDLDQLLSNPPPELEEALLRHKDRLLALLEAGPELPPGGAPAPTGKPAP